MELSGTRILLINPNRYRFPPVIPLGLEYLAHALRKHSFEVRVLDLCFSTDPLRKLENKVRSYAPGVVGVTIRNLDSALYPDTEYFLPEIRELIGRIRRTGDLPVIIGGSALPADPEGIRNFVGADVAIVGPGEKTLPAILQDINVWKGTKRIVYGEGPESFRPRREGLFAYNEYLSRDGLAGFETHKGCSSGCPYCLEARSPVHYRHPDDVVGELRHLAGQGIRRLHLCDSEFNEDLGPALDFLRALEEADLGLQWALYMKPGNYSPELFERLRKTGADLVTLSVDSLHQTPDYWKDVEEMISQARRNGIGISVDFLTGFPFEDEETLQRSLDFFREAVPDEVVVNVHLRLYRSLPLTDRILGDPPLKRFVTGLYEGGSLLSPVFYSHLPVERLRELIGQDPLFRIAGAEKVVNYQVQRPGE
ncbi:MAG: radical SAM protein [Deltaproteobacteria bacterium]|nr:radical SAM protein [Deltaproteobacteria bacterium]